MLFRYSLYASNIRSSTENEKRNSPKKHPFEKSPRKVTIGGEKAMLFYCSSLNINVMENYRPSIR